jgi:hypothetical protein
LNFCLGKLETIFGSKKVSLGAYLVCTVISFLYSVYGFIGAWAFGGPGSIGNTRLLPDGWDLDERQAFAVLLILFSLAVYAFTAFPLTALQLIRRLLRRAFPIQLQLRATIQLFFIAIALMVVNAWSDDLVLPILLGICALTLGVWLACMVLFGGLFLGTSAALFSGLNFDGTHRFLAAIAILGIAALGGSRGTKPVAELVSRRHRILLAHVSAWLPIRDLHHSIYMQIFPIVVFGIIGATGGAGFVTSSVRTYSYLLGPTVDSELLRSVGFVSTTVVIPSAAAVAGFIGGILAAVFGPGAVVLSGFVSATLLIIILSTRILSPFTLADYLSARTFVGAALINILLFFVILPPLNAFWDWLAWESSRALSRKLLENISGRKIILHIFVSLGIGIGLVIGLTVSAAEVVTFFNHWMVTHTQSSFLPLDSLAKTALQRPFTPDGIWISIMLFSTLLPTLGHLIFAVFGALIVRTPARWRTTLIRIISEPTSSAQLMLPILYFTFIPVVGLLVVGCLIWTISFVFVVLGIPISLGLFWLVHSITA